LYTLKQNDYPLSYPLNKFSICLFKTKGGKNKIKIFEINTRVKKFSNALS